MSFSPAPGTSLQAFMDGIPSLVDYFYNDTQPPAPHRRGRLDPFIPREVTNWRDEQRGWRESATLFDLSHHMPEMFLTGPDALRLLEWVGINSFKNFPTDRAKQLVGCTPQGHIIGDCILYRHGEDSFELVSGLPLLNWIEYQIQTGDWDVTVQRDAPSPFNPAGKRVKYRYQIEGPRAVNILHDLVGPDAPTIAFFRTATVTIAGREVLVLRHGMAGHEGLEISGPWEDQQAVLDAVLAAGEPYAMLRGGTYAYFSACVESGWPAYLLSGIYTDPALRGYREWLPSDGWEGGQHIGGSFVSSNIEDYYVTPWDLGYDRVMRFDHDFIGREKLESQLDQPHRTKVSLMWNEDDVMEILHSQFGDRTRYKALDLPVSSYGYPHYDEVRNSSGALIGLSTYTGYSNNDGVLASIGLIETAEAIEGREVTVLWGEQNGGSRKPEVERHVQRTVRATIAPSPYSEVARRLKTATA